MKKDIIQLSDHFSYGRLLRFTLPSIVMMVFTSIYGVVDGIFVSNFAGKTAFAAINLIMPYIMMFGTLGIMVGTGGTALVSMTMGAGDHKQANAIFSQLVYVCIGFGVILSTAGIALLRPVSIALGAEGQMIDDCVLYGRLTLPALTALILQMAFQSFCVAAEKPNLGLGLTIGAGITNIVLDALFVGFFHWGLAGAAIATVIGQFAGAFVGLYFNEKYNPEVQFGRRYAKLDGRIIKGILTVGVPSIIMNSIGSFMNFSMNQILQSFKETATGVFGIYFKLQSFFFMPLFGINNATISIIAYNYGARKPERIIKTLKLACTVAVCMMTAGLLVFNLLPDLLLGMFNPSEEFLEIGRAALRIISLGFLISSVPVTVSGALEGMGRGPASLVVCMLRFMIVIIPVAYILSRTYGATGVWHAFWINEWICALLSGGLFLRVYQKAKEEPQLPE